MTRLLCLLLALCACAPRYSTKPPLPFADLDYKGPSGTQWPVAFASLPHTAQQYGMATVPKVAYVELNKGGAKGDVVFIHGLGSYLKFWWYQLDVMAAQGWHVVALDLPGYGKSDKPATFPYTMEAMADAARELCAQLGVAKPVVVGHSMGGQTALSWAIRYPDAVRGLVLVSPAGMEQFNEREQAWFNSAMTRPLILRANEYAIWGSVALANFSRFRPELEWLIEDRVRLAKAPGFEPYAYAQVRSVQGLAHNDFVRENLDKVQAPTLLVYGEEDRLIPNPFLHGGWARDVFEPGIARIKGGKLAPLPGCGHASQLDCPSEWAAAVGPFLEALPR